MTEKYLLKIIEEIIEANEYDEEMINVFSSYDLENKYEEIGNMDGFIDWVRCILEG